MGEDISVNQKIYKKQEQILFRNKSLEVKLVFNAFIISTKLYNHFNFVSLKEIVGTLDEKYFDQQKALNLMKFENEKKLEKLRSLRKQNEMLNVGGNEGEDDGRVVIAEPSKREAFMEMVGRF